MRDTDRDFFDLVFDKKELISFTIKIFCHFHMVVVSGNIN